MGFKYNIPYIPYLVKILFVIFAHFLLQNLNKYGIIQTKKYGVAAAWRRQYLL